MCERLAYAASSGAVCILARTEQGGFEVSRTMVGHTHVRVVVAIVADFSRMFVRLLSTRRCLHWRRVAVMESSFGTTPRERCFIGTIFHVLCNMLMDISMAPDTNQYAHEGHVECLLYIYEGSTLVSGSRDNTLKAWDALDGYVLMETIMGHKGHVLTLDFCSALDLLVSAGRELQIKIWDVKTLNPAMRAARADNKGIHVQLHQNIDAHRGDVTCVRWAAGGEKLFSGARDNEIKVWDRATGKAVKTISGHRVCAQLPCTRGCRMYDMNRVISAS